MLERLNGPDIWIYLSFSLEGVSSVICLSMYCMLDTLRYLDGFNVGTDIFI